MKITDKMRLDFLGTRYFTVRCDAYWAVVKEAETENQLGRGGSVREAIDAAIRAGERNKI
jgi:hypothetical protein